MAQGRQRPGGKAIVLACTIALGPAIEEHHDRQSFVGRMPGRVDIETLARLVAIFNVPGNLPRTSVLGHQCAENVGE